MLPPCKCPCHDWVIAPSKSSNCYCLCPPMVDPDIYIGSNPNKSTSRLPAMPDEDDGSWMPPFLAAATVFSAVAFVTVKVVDDTDAYPLVHLLSEAIFYAFAIAFAVNLPLTKIRKARRKGGSSRRLPSPIAFFLIAMTTVIVLVNSAKVNGGLQLIQESAFYVFVTIVLFVVLDRHYGKG